LDLLKSTVSSKELPIKQKPFVLTILSLISGLAVNRLAGVSGISTINGTTVINVPSAATDVLAGVIGIPTVACVHAAGIPDTADVPAADDVTDETGIPALRGWID
jgi:hypothetical protein